MGGACNLLYKYVGFMLTKLQENSWKNPWHRYSVKWLMNRLRQEHGELQKAIKEGAPPEEVWREAADVGNMAAMAADVYEREHKEAQRRAARSGEET